MSKNRIGWFYESASERKNNGYEPNRSSFTDICTLCKTICGVNFSIGYYNEHSKDEYLNVNEWLNTYEMVKKIATMDFLPRFDL